MVSRLLHQQAGVHHDGLEPEMSASLDTRPIPSREVSGGEAGTPLGEVQKNTNRHSKRWVKEAFEHRPENAEKQATCRYCHKVRSTLNPTRQKEHLLNKKECQFLQSEDARMSTDPEVQSILAGGSLHPTPRRPKSEREPGSSGMVWQLLSRLLLLVSSGTPRLVRQQIEQKGSDTQEGVLYLQRVGASEKR